MIAPETKAAARRAADWLRKHPDKHIQGKLAMTRGGREVLPDHPAATCFCAVGRFALELGNGREPYKIVNDAVGNVIMRNIWVKNDSNKATALTLLDQLAE